MIEFVSYTGKYPHLCSGVRLLRRVHLMKTAPAPISLVPVLAALVLAELAVEVML